MTATVYYLILSKNHDMFSDLKKRIFLSDQVNCSTSFEGVKVKRLPLDFATTSPLHLKNLLRQHMFLFIK